MGKYLAVQAASGSQESAHPITALTATAAAGG